MKRTLVILFGFIASTALINTSYAETRDPHINRQQHHQNKRITNGVKSGELTKDEAKELRSDRKAIREEERAYKADGKLTKEERTDLRQDLRENSKNIYEEKHDSEKRPRKH